MQIGQELGISKERVRQIEARANAKLRTMADEADEGVAEVLDMEKALIAAKVPLIYDGSHDSQGDKQIEDARPGVALEEPPPPQNEADKEQRQGSAEPLVDGHAGDADVVFHPEQPAGNCGEWRDDRGEAQRPPAGIAERLLAKDPGEDVAAD